MYLNNSMYFHPAGGVVSFAEKSKKSLKSNKDSEKKINVPALAFSIVGTALPMIMIAKHQKQSIFKIDYELKEMLTVGTGSIAGGLLGGIISDKGKNTVDKIREANYQWITNLAVPTILVAQFLKIAEKSPFNKKISKAVAALSGVILGLVSGAFVSNLLNRSFSSNDEYKRNLKWRDAMLHVDDIPMALTLSKIPYVDKLLPFLFTMSGYEAGRK